MIKIIAILSAFLISSSSFAGEIICTINKFKGFAWSGIAAVSTLDLSKNIENNNFVLKKDGTLIQNVRYADMVYKPASSLGDVDGAIFIALSRDGGQQQGINVIMGKLSNEQKIASFDLNVSSPTDRILVNNHEKGIGIGCQTPVK